MNESKHNPLVAVTQFLDPYARQARLYPALIVICPFALLVMVWFPALWTTLGAVASVASSFGLVILLAQVARDRGKRLEPALYDSWGGKPSVAFLRHGDARIDEYTKARYREFLKVALPKLTLPSPEDEERNPAASDHAYQSVTNWLLTQTRDTKRFSILFRENVSFGFRRNLWGLKPIGVTVTFLTAAGSTAAILYRYWTGFGTPAAEVAVVTAVVWLLLIVWIVVITPAWVRIPADAYGSQLLAACDTLTTPQSGKPRRARRQAEKS
jgi:hypothetical protein